MSSALAAFVLVAALVVGGGLGCRDGRAPPEQAAAATRSPADRRPAVVFLGDSLTAGLGLAADESLPALIQRRTDAESLGLRVINAGRSGDTSAGGLARLGWYLRPEVDLAALVINLGSNDALRGLSLGELEKNLSAIIRSASAAAPAARIFLVQLETFPNLGPEYVADFRAVFPRVAAATGATLVPFPLEGIAGVAALNQADGVHPTAEGTQKMADAMWRALEADLRGLGAPPGAPTR